MSEHSLVKPLQVFSFGPQFLVAATRGVPGVQPGRVYGVPGVRRPPGEAGLGLLHLPVPRQQHLLRVLRKEQEMCGHVTQAAESLALTAVALCPGPERAVSGDGAERRPEVD